MKKEFYTLEEVMAELNRVKPWYERVYRSFYRNLNLYKKIKSGYHNIKWFIQRGRRGWSDCDAWNFYGYLAKVISEATASLRDKHFGYPSDLTDEQWTKILDNISKLFTLVNANEIEKLYADIDYNDSKSLRTAYDKEAKQLKEALKGFKLLEKYFYNLWD